MWTFEVAHPFAAGLEVRRHRLHNGLTLLSLADGSAPIVSYQTWFAVGSSHERPGATGMAHLFEHLMFNQTRTRPPGVFDRLIEGAGDAARSGLKRLGEFTPDVAVLISCVGRKLVLRQRVEEEVECVREVLGPRPVLTGFYSYGEICPHGAVAQCELHNQTMTITAFAES